MDLNEITIQQASRASDTEEYLASVFSRSFLHKKFKQNIDVCERHFSFSIDIEVDEEVEKYNKVSEDVKACIEKYRKDKRVNVFTQPSSRGTNSQVQYISEEFYVKITEWSGKLNLEFFIIKDCSIFSAVIERLEELSAVDPDKRNEFSVLIKSTHGLSTRTLRNGTCPLEPSNYVPEVMEGQKKMVQELAAENPNGRLSILEGPPGTGKTFLIRSLPLQVPDSMFIVIPPALVSHLGDPEIVGSLLAIRDDLLEDGKTITLILEDADDCLQKRDGSNTSLVSALLNSTSGILGEALNLRIVATSNLPKAKIDEAILRPGRLGAYVQVGDLDKEVATAVYQRLVNDDTAVYNVREHGLSLADVYGAAKGSGRMNIKFNKKTTERRIGFDVDTPTSTEKSYKVAS